MLPNLKWLQDLNGTAVRRRGCNGCVDPPPLAFTDGNRLIVLDSVSLGATAAEVGLLQGMAQSAG